MSRIAVATNRAPREVPIYEVHEVKNRKVAREVYTRTAVEGGKPGQTEMKVTVEEVVLPISYMVFFPAGHAVAFDSAEHMKEAGIDMNSVRMIDPETGDVVGQQAPMSLRARSEAREQLRRI